MHRVRFSSGSTSGTLFGDNGLLLLPEAVQRALGAYGIALAPGFALLLTDEGPKPLVALGVHKVDQTSIVWEPDTATVRPVLGVEPTTSEAEPAARTRWNLVNALGESVTLGLEPLVLGRHPRCHMVLDDPRVSTFHAMVALTHHGIRLIDLRSKNGCYIDGVRVREATVTRRTTAALGQTRLFIIPEEPRPAYVPPQSPKMRQVFDAVDKIAKATVAVLLQGESGVGKEVVARRIHEVSGRVGRFVAVNGALLTPNLAATELFGHVRGAFTGATRESEGAFGAAHDGTLFLDEVAELPLEVQAELLRAVELSRIRKVGDHREHDVSVRIITATHKDLPELVRTGRFRADLYHRLCVVPLTIPPLRARPEDLLAVSEDLLSRETPARRLSEAAKQKLLAHPWPGNVRELLNTLRRSVLFCQRVTLEADDFILGPEVEMLKAAASLSDVIYERVLSTYQELGSVAATAKKLGLRRSMVHRILREEERAKRGDLWLHEGEHEV